MSDANHRLPELALVEIFRRIPFSEAERWAPCKIGDLRIHALLQSQAALYRNSRALPDRFQNACLALGRLVDTLHARLHPRVQQLLPSWEVFDAFGQRHAWGFWANAEDTCRFPYHHGHNDDYVHAPEDEPAPALDPDQSPTVSFVFRPRRIRTLCEDTPSIHTTYAFGVEGFRLGATSRAYRIAGVEEGPYNYPRFECHAMHGYPDRVAKDVEHATTVGFGSAQAPPISPEDAAAIFTHPHERLLAMYFTALSLYALCQAAFLGAVEMGHHAVAATGAFLRCVELGPFAVDLLLSHHLLTNPFLPIRAFSYLSFADLERLHVVDLLSSFDRVTTDKGLGWIFRPSLARTFLSVFLNE